MGEGRFDYGFAQTFAKGLHSLFFVVAILSPISLPVKHHHKIFLCH